MRRALLIGTIGTVAASLSGALLLRAPEVEAQDNSLALLRTLEPGQWELRYRGSDNVRRLCVRSGEAFIQLRHSGRTCRRFVVEAGERDVTVQYTCSKDGYGRTNVKRENRRLVQIEGQGIVDGAPFQFSAEARRVGNCP